MFQNIGLAFQGVWNHKLRSLLTMLGIIIGIASIITIVSTIKGTNEQIKQNLIGSGTNTVRITLSDNGGEEVSLQYTSIPEGIRVITEDDLKEIRDLPGVVDATAYRQRYFSEAVYYGNTLYNGSVYGVDSHYFSTNNYRIHSGRGFIEEDYSNFRKVMILDAPVASSLFNGRDPVGEIVEVNGEPYTVVGVVSQTVINEPVINNLRDYYMYSGETTAVIFIPDVCWDISYRYDEPQNVTVRAASTDEMASVGKAAADALTAAVINGAPYSYKASNLLEQASELQALSDTTNSQLIWIAGISLLVGGIGVMNIMLVSVTERTREIGLKIAIGARGGRIRGQFLTEAAVLTLMGGLLGVAAGIGLSYMMSHVLGTPVAISVPACVIAVAFSTLIGIIFGLVPAVKASRLNPIDALRHE